MTVGHSLTITMDDEGWEVSTCSCGWVGSAAGDVGLAAKLWADHLLTATT